MAYDLETARIRIGLESTDTSKDVELTAAMEASLHYAEKYCDRFFMFQEDVAELIHFESSYVQLHRYPVTAVASIKFDSADFMVSWVPLATAIPIGGANESSWSASRPCGEPLEVPYHIEKKTGRLVFDSRFYSHELTVNYSGGYAVLPADLEMALWRLFDSTWSVISATTSSAPVGGGAIKAISSQGARVEFDTSSAGSGMGGSGGLSDSFANSILDLYGLKSC